MLRFSTLFVAILALISSMTIAVPPALAYTGKAYDKCMQQCQKDGISNRCSYWCESRH